MSNITTCGPNEHPCTGCGLPVDNRLTYCNLCEETHARDNCEVCGGERGGVKGNENVIDGVVTCDYCTADDMRDKANA